MLHGSWSGLAHGRVNPAAPLLAALIGIALFFAGYRSIGLGLVAGAVLAFINALLLSGRVELAADQGDIGRALLVMQMGFVVTCSIIGAATIIIVHFSVPMAVAAAIAFAVSQTGMLATFYLRRGRALGNMESKPS
jgi:hypothetical protein